MGKLSFPEVIATNGNDSLRSGSNQITFALRGDDTIRADAWSEYNIIAGGAGKDTYIAGTGTAMTVVDSGGFDTVVAYGIGLNSVDTYAVTVEGQHLLAWDYGTGQQVAIADWQDPAKSIESFRLSDGTYTLTQIQSAVANSPNFLGDYTVEEVAAQGLLPVGTTAADLQALLDGIEARDAQLSAPPPAVAEVAGLDDAFYLAHNPDVAASGMDPDTHFDRFGWREGRDPNDWFDTDWYLAANPDVEAAGINPLVHFMNQGVDEGRDPNAYFDVDWYFSQNPDVAEAGMNPVEHYWLFGWKEGRDPSEAFDTEAYLAANPDVDVAGMNPLEHWLQFGQMEGRELG